ncbi:hypothetical protein [Acaryochloris thomasi]|uniref:hypothetical protein n=1 Tax=Acaryochloris thomasi TaxID=2929456 RepID=UPI001314CED6|nr:hypothetical protein [Acaryochloris thomasi]
MKQDQDHSQSKSKVQQITDFIVIAMLVFPIAGWLGNLLQPAPPDNQVPAAWSDER